ncbi:MULTISPECIES: DMT family transporter [Brevibacillus]|uniref:DMT family transporter n=1 Tax=Brevibacillus TaxID=55080 RepID=UPI000271AB2C|nr:MULTISPECIES: DMT family transporter [Brevibacillus]EJL38885.1 DMT(drug/metabolite transporter) superfamily permease [Brevibacillus sp. CF112]MED1824387.1 DMT family transporter [Brevibacillus agri]
MKAGGSLGRAGWMRNVAGVGARAVMDDGELLKMSALAQSSGDSIWNSRLPAQLSGKSAADRGVQGQSNSDTMLPSTSTCPPSKPPIPGNSMPPEKAGLLYGLLGVCSFSLTLPATKVVVTTLSPVSAGLGRALIAALLAALVLWLKRVPLPTWAQLKQLVLVSAGVVIGFPFFSSWAMERVPATHGAVIIALLPLATAGAAAFFSGERPAKMYWISSGVACLTIIGYAVFSGFSALQWADLALLGAVISAAVGYAVGGQLSKTMGGWQVISWSLLIAFPFLVVPIAGPLLEQLQHATWTVWAGFGYISVVSMFLGFFAWYHGLALGGVARVSQTQYLQPFLSILAAWLLLSEPFTPGAVLAAVIVVFAVARGKNASIQQKQKAPSTNGKTANNK